NFYFIFPIHPRTKKNLINFQLFDELDNLENTLITKPLGYLDFYKIFSKSLCVLTDSGGIQEEASIMRVPCITLRNNTERPETLEYGSNILVGMDMNKLKEEIFRVRANSDYLKGKATENPFGDGKSSERIVQIMKDLYNKNLLNLDISKLWFRIPNRNLTEINHLEESLSVKNYELTHQVKIQLLFDEEGVPCFPYDHKIIRNGYKILLVSK
ncbi:MAG: UDP-N-acetylglucosamine 2-epimerase, partial [Candidatus Lokiarchaeia archaeon]